ncbi:MAG: DVUA0089 family protein [Gemmatimonadota bacterium]|nr:MAG: DVUA0089 family protein [Gemmatimonadota bacterium]
MSKRALCLALLALLAGGAEGLAQRPKEKDPRPTVRPRVTVPMTAAATVPESEPNDDYTTADAVSLGDQATGTIDPAGDWDWFVFSATAGQMIEIDVDAEEVGSDLDSYMYLYDTDGTTELAYNDDWGGWYDSHIEYTFTAAGNYYIALREYSDPDAGGPTYTYAINFTEVLPGVGDPVTEFASGFVCVFGLVAADDGTIYAADPCASEVREVATDGTVSTFVFGDWWPIDLTLDAFGNLIVASDDGWIYKVSPEADVTAFAERYAPAITTASDGSIWAFGYPGGVAAQAAAAAQGDFYFYQYDPLGNLVDSLAVSGSSPDWLSIGFSPAGELHYSVGDTIYKLVDGIPQSVAVDENGGMGPFAFDTEGNLYVVNWDYYDVALYGPDGTLLEDPFARGVYSPMDIVFGRDADGTPNGRVFIADNGQGGELVSPMEGLQRVAQVGSAILELNADGVYEDGAVVGMSMDMLTDDGLAAELFGVGELTDGEKDFLDFMGNQNGEYDVGDFRAFLVYTGTLPGVAQGVSWR